MFGQTPTEYRAAWAPAARLARIPRCVAQAYGIDTSVRDPSGNNIRLTQVLDYDPNRAADQPA